jgi:hypothetical protein
LGIEVCCLGIKGSSHDDYRELPLLPLPGLVLFLQWGMGYLYLDTATCLVCVGTWALYLGVGFSGINEFCGLLLGAVVILCLPRDLEPMRKRDLGFQEVAQGRVRRLYQA